MISFFSIDFPDISALRQHFNCVEAYKDLITEGIFMERLLEARL